jgi:Coenzyme PQQ synthesis protein D (PqqD)
MTTFPKSRTKDLVVQNFETEVLIYDLTTNKAFCLNESSSLVLQYADGKNSVSEIANLMSQKLKTLVTEDLVWLALDQLKKDDLLENCTEIEINFNGLNRREIIKKIGFASMVALPLISSVIAPTSAMAASCSLIAPGGIILNVCDSTSSGCQLNAGNQCCSGLAISVSQPCPLAPVFMSACQCV